MPAPLLPGVSQSPCDSREKTQNVMNISGMSHNNIETLFSGLEVWLKQ
jgi:hypothetical protein